MMSEITCRPMPFLTCHTCHRFSPPGTPGLACHPPQEQFLQQKGTPWAFGSDRVGTEGTMFVSRPLQEVRGTT